MGEQVVCPMGHEAQLVELRLFTGSDGPINGGHPSVSMMKVKQINRTERGSAG